MYAIKPAVWFQCAEGPQRSLFFAKYGRIYYRTFNANTGGAWSTDKVAGFRSRFSDEVRESSKLTASATKGKIYVYYLRNTRGVVEIVGTPPEHGPNVGEYSWEMPEEQGGGYIRARLGSAYSKSVWEIALSVSPT